MDVITLGTDSSPLVLIEQILRLQGHEVFRCAGDTLALEAVREGHYSLLIIDHCRDDYNGAPLCRQIRKLKTRNAPVILAIVPEMNPRRHLEKLDRYVDDYIIDTESANLVLARLAIAEKRVEINARRERSIEVLQETANMRIEGRSARINNLLLAKRWMNHLLLRETHAERFLRRVCESLCETGTYLSASIALTDAPPKIKKRVIAGMDDQGNVDPEIVSEQGPVGCLAQAFAREELLVIDETSPVCSGCLSAARCKGRSRMISRMEHNGKLHGFFIVSLPVRFSANREEQEFFEEIAGDTALTLHRIEKDEERRLTEESLRVSKERYSLLVENANDAIFILQDGLIRFPNPVTLSLTGYSEEELASLPFENLVHPEDRERICKKQKMRVRGGRLTNTYAFRLVDKTGREKWVDVNAALIPWERRPATLNLMRDISEQKRLEVQLSQTQKMEAIGTLAGGIAHDFNNILTAIIGFSQLGLLSATVEDTHRENYEQVLKAGQRGKELVQQILMFSRHGENEMKPLQLSSIVKEALKLLRATLPSSLKIQRRIDGATGTILAHPTQMHQVLINLCTNAAHAMRNSNGYLEVGLQEVTLSGSELEKLPTLRTDSCLKLFVRDAGTGMEPGVLEQIFEPFFTTKEQGEGTGLGLPVVQGIVHKHGGAIQVASEVGKGTTFELFFPLIPGEREQTPVEERGIRQGTERILFIDDEPSLVEAGKKMLVRLGYNVTSTTRPAEALALFKETPDRFDLVITDQTMPELTGVEIAKQMLALRKDLGVILCTGFSESVSPETAEALGISAFLMKPFRLNELTETIRAVLEDRNASVEWEI